MAVPSTGTIRMLPHTVFQKSGDYQSGTAGATCGSLLASMSNADIATYLNADVGGAPTPNSRWTREAFCAPDCFGVFPGAGLHLLKFSPATDEIIFNPGGGQQVIDLLTSDFPLGLLISALQVSFIGTAKKNSSGVDIVDFHLIWGNTNVHTLATPSINNTTVNSSSTAIIAGGTSQGILTALTYLGVDATHVEATTVFTACGDIPTSQSQFAIRNLRFIMNYSLWSNALAISPATVYTDTVVTVTDGNNKLLQLTDAKARYRNADKSLSSPFPITLITHTSGQMTFLLPEEVFAGEEILVSGTGNGAEFTGEVNLGPLSSGLVNASGIYKLVEGQTFDRYYDRSVSPVVTVDLSILSPFGKTGFF